MRARTMPTSEQMTNPMMTQSIGRRDKLDGEKVEWLAN